MATSLACSLGIHLYATNGGSFTNVGMPPTRGKAATYLQEPPSLCNLRNGHDSITAPSVKPDLGFSSHHEGCWLCQAHPGTPENVTGPCLVGWHRYTRLTGRLAPC